MTFDHKSVLLEETVDSLNICPGGIYVDGTWGPGEGSSALTRTQTRYKPLRRD